MEPHASLHQLRHFTPLHRLVMENRPVEMTQYRRVPCKGNDSMHQSYAPSVREHSSVLHKDACESRSWKPGQGT